MIKNLLEYQEKDKQRLALIARVEAGAVKREINAANRALNEAKASLLELENDARNLQTSYLTLQKRQKDLVSKADALKKNISQSDAAASVSVNITELTRLEGQLEQLSKAINAKMKLYEERIRLAGTAQTRVRNLTPQYEAQINAIKPEADKILAEMAKIPVDKVLLEKYKTRRKAEQGKISDITVPVINGRCGACNMELPNIATHKISVDGFIICEECGKIIYKKG